MSKKITVSVASRVEPPIAKRLVDSAKQMGITLSKQIELILTTWTYQESESERINKEWKDAAGKLINQFAETKKRQEEMTNFLIQELKSHDRRTQSARS